MGLLAEDFSLGFSRARLARVAALLLAALLSGCGSLDVNPSGTLTTPIVAAPISTDCHPVLLAADRLGNLTINGQALDLPSAREDTRLGLRLVDVSDLPPGWRPRHASGGGFLVTLLHKASPLAIAGLRPLDRVVTLNGEPLRNAQTLEKRLRNARRREVVLDVVRFDGQRFRMTAEADERVAESTRSYVPLLFDQRDSSTGTAFGFGPFEVLFYWRSARRHQYVPAPSLANSQYHECFEWGLLGNAFKYQRERDPMTGEVRSRFRLLWLFGIGDEL